MWGREDTRGQLALVVQGHREVEWEWDDDGLCSVDGHRCRKRPVEFDEERFCCSWGAALYFAALAVQCEDLDSRGL